MQGRKQSPCTEMLTLVLPKVGSPREHKYILSLGVVAVTARAAGSDQR